MLDLTAAGLTMLVIGGGIVIGAVVIPYLVMGL